MWRSGLSVALLGFRYDPDELVAAADALPIGAEFVNAASSQDKISPLCRFKGFRCGFAVDDTDHFAAAVGAFAGFAGYGGDGVGFLFHGAWFDKVNTILSFKKECRVVILGPIGRIPPLFRHS
jgi:hypothetical protein